MNYDALKVWIDALQFLWIIGATVWAFWGNQGAVTRQKIAQQRGELNDMGGRVTRLEEAALHSPTHKDLGDIHDKLNEVSKMCERIGGEVRTVRAEVSGVRELIPPLQRTIELVNEHLLSQK